MISSAISFARKWVTIVLTRPLRFGEAVGVGSAILGLGTIYCQIYCLLALQQMHGMSMPILASAHRASVDVISSFVAFELSKRVMLRDRHWNWLLVVFIFAAIVALAVYWRMQLDLMNSGLTPRRMAVDRIPFMALAAAGLAYYRWRLRHPVSPIPGARASCDLESLPPAGAIEWVKAAGNYVEIRVSGHTRLVRGALHQIAAVLPEPQFVQIHRSVIVNRAKVAGTNGRRTVRMTDGTEFSVGDAYRSNLT